MYCHAKATNAEAIQMPRLLPGRSQAQGTRSLLGSQIGTLGIHGLLQGGSICDSNQGLRGSVGELVPSADVRVASQK